MLDRDLRCASTRLSIAGRADPLMNLTLSEDAGVLQALQLVGSAAFALSTPLAARRKKADLFGVTALGLIPAIGGGTLLDLVSEATPVFWIAAPRFVLLSVLTALGGALLVRRLPARRWQLARWVDALGVAAWTVAGTELSLARGAGPLSAVALGGLVGVAGGLLRDTFFQRAPGLAADEFYATAVLLGASLHVFFAHTPLGTAATCWLSAGAVLVLRGTALRRARL